MSNTDPHSSKPGEDDKTKAGGSPSPADEIADPSLEEVSGGINIQKVVLAQNPDGTVYYKPQGDSRPL